jgi:hypothetical protein
MRKTGACLVVLGQIGPRDVVQEHGHGQMTDLLRTLPHPSYNRFWPPRNTPANTDFAI